MFHILVADDDKNTRKYMKAVLEAGGYTVSTAGNGLEALEIMKKEHIDLIVLDIMMPGMDGYELTKELREASDNIPILMVSRPTASGGQEKRISCGHRRLYDKAGG